MPQAARATIDTGRRIAQPRPEIDVSAIRPVERPKQLVPSDVDRPTDAVKELVKGADRIYRMNVQEASMNSARWKKMLTEEQLEEVGAMVEGIGNLRTGKTAEQIRRTFTPEQRQVLNEYRTAQEQARQNVNDFLRTTGEEEYIKYLDNYLSHFYVADEKKVKPFITKWVKNSPHAKQRVLPTLQDAVDAGLTPLTQNVAELHAKWANINWRVAVNRRIVSELSNIQNADGLPVIMKPDQAPGDWVHVDHPAIQRQYATKNPDGSTTIWRGGAAVDPEVYPILRQIFDEPFTGNLVKSVETFNAYAKKAQLSFSLFHHWALTESAQAALARGTNPLRGLLLAGGKGETLGAGLRLPGGVYITRPHTAGLKLMESPEFMRDATNHGLVLGALEDAQIGKVQSGLKNLEVKTRNIPGAGFLARKLRQANQWWDTALWDHYHNGLKAYAYYDLVKEALKKAPDDITEPQMRQIKEKIAELVNDMFGGQEWTTKFKATPGEGLMGKAKEMPVAGKVLDAVEEFYTTPKGRQLMHIALLAPDWTISNLNVARKAFTRAHDPVQRRILARYWRNMLGTFAAYVSAFNYVASGKWPWENEPEHKMDINVSKIMNALPWKEKEERQYYIRPGKQFREVLSWVQNPVKILGHKASPAVHQAVQQMSGVQLGDMAWEMPWTREEMGFYQSLPSRVKSVMESFVPFSARGNQFAFAFPMSRGMGAWKAQRAFEDLIKMDIDPTFTQQMYGRTIDRRTTTQKRKELNRACALNGLDAEKMYKQAQTKVRTEYYNKMWAALEAENYKEADRAAKVLLELGATAETVKRSGESRGLDSGVVTRGVESMNK